MATQPRFKFTAIEGFFALDKGATRLHPSDASIMPELTTLPGLGLIDQRYPTDSSFDPEGKRESWERFTHYLHHLNETAQGKASYKLIFATRHGQGYHNAKESAVGTLEWESKWVHLNGDDNTTWFDSHLNPLGRSQALSLREFWQTSTSALKLPLPQSYYSSPLTRCLETCQLSFSGISDALRDASPAPPSFRPIVKELLRERLHRHTCDRRRTRSYIAENFPLFQFEEGFTEEDELWRPEGRETLGEHVERVRILLSEVFFKDKEEIVSFTGHYGTIEALIAVTGHSWFEVSPANVVPFLIKAEEVVVAVNG